MSMNQNAKRQKMESFREVKNHDHELTNSTFGQTGTVTLINDIPQGTSAEERIGKIVQLTSLSVRGNFRCSNLGTRGTMLVVYDSMPTGALPTVADILTDDPSGNLVYSNKNSYNSSRFKILKRNTYPNNELGAFGQGSTWDNQVDIYIKLHNLFAEYKNLGTGDITDISKGAIYIVTAGSVTSLLTSFDFTTRVRYRD